MRSLRFEVTLLFRILFASALLCFDVSLRSPCCALLCIVGECTESVASAQKSNANKQQMRNSNAIVAMCNATIADGHTASNAPDLF